MKFNYKAKKGLDEKLEGYIEAENQEEAVNKLNAQGLFPISIVEVKLLSAEAASGKKKQASSRRKKVSSKEVLQFTRKLATLSRARVELLSSLRIIHDQTDNLYFKEIILEIYNATKEGKAFSETLARFPNIFSSLFTNLIKTGEATGKLDFALSQISDFLSRDDTLKNKVKVALAYPALLLLVGVASIFVLINFVIPKLKPLFSGLGKDLPFVTKLILQLSELSNKSWWIIVAAAGAVFLFLYYQKGGKFFKQAIAELKRKTPVIKQLVRNQELAYFARAFGLLLKSGVPALKSLEIATPTISDPKLRDELSKVCLEVAAGKSLSWSMENFTTLPKFLVKMVAVGEESGRLTEVLDEVYDSYTQATESDIALVTSLIEPVLILVMGSILGTIVLSILLPTFQITQMVR